MTKDALRYQVLRTAARMFLEQGYTAATVRKLAERSGVDINVMIRILITNHI